MIKEPSSLNVFCLISLRVIFVFCFLRMKQLFVPLRVDPIFARLKNSYKWQTIGEIERCNKSVYHAVLLQLSLNSVNQL